MDIFPISYAAPISYFSEFLKCSQVTFEWHEYFPKQTIRNHCNILTSHGAMKLSIPLADRKNKSLTKDIRISYSENWQAHHWKSLVTAYNKSPFFEHYAHRFEPFYHTKFEFLFELNEGIFKAFCKCLKIEKPIQYTNEFIENEEHIDFRKFDFSNVEVPKYYQVFSNKIPFTSGLSMYDLLFNEGPKSIDILRLMR